MKKKGCVVILSHSSYQDIWEITLQSFKKYFPKDVDTFITSDHHLTETTQNMVADLGMRILYYPNNISWSAAMRHVVNGSLKGQYDFVIFSFDDLALIEKVDETSFYHAMNAMDNMDYLILNKTHHNLFSAIRYGFSSSPYIPVSKNDSYVGSLVFSAWDTDFIHTLINQPIFDDINPWQYECLVSKMIHTHERKGFFMMKTPLVTYANMIIKGKIYSPELKKAEKSGNIFYTGNRGLMSASEEGNFTRYSTVFKMARYFLPHRVFRKFRKSY